MTYSFIPKGVCSRKIDLELDNGIINKITFTGGCNGNLQGISRLLVGMSAAEAVTRLQGIKCGFKNTSCPDQLSKALTQALNK